MKLWDNWEKYKTLVMYTRICTCVDEDEPIIGCGKEEVSHQGGFFFIFRIFIGHNLNTCYWYLFIIQAYYLFSLYCVYVCIYLYIINECTTTWVPMCVMCISMCWDSKITKLFSTASIPREEPIVILVTLLFVNRVNIIIIHRWRMFVNNVKTYNWNKYRTAKNYTTLPFRRWTF